MMMPPAYVAARNSSAASGSIATSVDIVPGASDFAETDCTAAFVSVSETIGID